MHSLAESIRQRLLILDGAMGTMIQRRGLTEADFRGTRFAQSPVPLKGNNDLLCLTRPDVVEDIHRRYLEAGADIIETNTFNATRISQADYHTEACVRDINLQAARLARSLADEYTRRTPEKPRYVAGSVGPTNKTLSLSPDVNNPALRSLTFDSLAEAYLEQMAALLEGGVDALLVETIFDTLNAKAAIRAAREAMERTGRTVPLMLSVTVSEGGRTLSGQTLDAFLASVEHAGLFSVGLNCSFGARQMKPWLEQLAARAPYYISAYPNAGLPNSLGQYDQTPEEMARELEAFVDEGLVNILGGCCGTTDEHIARLARLVDGARVHVPVRRGDTLCLSGLEVLEVKPENNFVNVGERCNVAGSRKFLRLINEKKYEYIAAKMEGKTLKDLENLAVELDTEIVPFENVRYVSFFVRDLGIEPRMIGAIASTDETSVLSDPIKGETGTFVFVVNEITESETPRTAEEEKVRQQTGSQTLIQSKLSEYLEQMAEVEDLRAKYF